MRIKFSLFALPIIALTACKKNNQDHPIAAVKVTVTTLAGDGTPNFADGPALSAKFNAPEDIVITADGTIYIADLFNSRIRKIKNGEVSTFAGNGDEEIVNGNGQSAKFIYPGRLALDGNNNLYVIDGVDPRLRKITPAADVTTYAGIETRGFKDGRVDMAQFEPGLAGIVADANGNIFVADTRNHRVRKISVSGEVSTIAGSGTAGFKEGNGTAAQFNNPSGLTIDRQGNLYVVDRSNYRIRKITATGEVSTVAGSGIKGDAGGIAAAAQFTQPVDLVIDSKGNLYVSDEFRIRKISVQGIVSTIAGSTEGNTDGNGTDAKFEGPTGMGIDAQDNIYVADVLSNNIRKISFE